MPTYRTQPFFRHNIQPHISCTMLVVLSMVFLLPISCGRREHRARSVRVGYVASAYYLPILLAKQEQLFAKHGVPVEFQVYSSNVELVNDFLNRNIDVTAQSALTMLQVEKQHPGSFRLIYGQYCDSYFFVAPKGKFTALTDLNDPQVRLVTWKSPTAIACIQLALSLAGHTPRDEKTIVQLPPQDLEAALVNNIADAAFVFDVIAAKVVQIGDKFQLLEADAMHRLLSTAPIGSTVEPATPFFNGGGFISNRLLLEHPELARKTRDILLEAVQRINGDASAASLVIFESLRSQYNLTNNMIGMTKTDKFTSLNEQVVEDARKTHRMMARAPTLQDTICSEDSIPSLFWLSE